MNILLVFFTQEDTVPSFPDIFEGSPMADIRILEDDVYSKLCSLDIAKSSCLDGWRSRVF